MHTSISCIDCKFLRLRHRGIAKPVCGWTREVLETEEVMRDRAVAYGHRMVIPGVTSREPVCAEAFAVGTPKQRDHQRRGQELHARKV